jgi:lysyl-tRNA synthetase class 2
MTTLWEPSALISTLQQRASLLSKIRNFFTTRAYLEVETPIMAQFGVTDLYLSNIPAFFREKSYALQTSPEYHMKRLLAAESGPIFQLARVFRDDELGRWHNPEFTLLEWYQLEIDHHELMQEVGELLHTVLNCPPLVKKTYEAVFSEIVGFNPFETSVEELRAVLQQYDLDRVLPEDELDKDQYLFLLMSHVIEPALATSDAPMAVYHFPASQAALAQVHNGVAHRFEVYYRGVELANGFHELTDPRAQQVRFEEDNRLRIKHGLKAVPHDEYLLEALRHGLPPCSGVALGIDRLLAIALGASKIGEVMAFDFERV